MDKTSIGNRMKGYERVSRTKLTRRTPVIIRLDGKAFHTWTKVLPYLDPSMETSPFSEMMHDCMSITAFELASNIQNATLTYTQSDEISILLNDWKGLKTEQWFDGNIQKMVSISRDRTTLPKLMVKLREDLSGRLSYDNFVNRFIQSLFYK